MKFKIYISLTIIILLLCNCTQSQKQDTTIKTEEIAIQLKHAKGFSIFNNNSYKTVVVYNPWNNTIMQKYYLVEDATIKVPKDGIKILTPLESIATSSCTHFEFINLIGEINTITGICTPELVYNKTILQRYKDNKIINLGDAFNTNLEKLLNLQPNAYMISSYNQNDENAKRIMQTGINIIYNNEWVENSLLARAEWIKFVAAFYNKEKEADSIFSSIEQEYNKAKKLTLNIKKRPTIMAGGNFKGTWYMPSGASYMGNLFSDAGASYKFSDDTTKGSIPLDFETVLNYFHDCDVWLNAPVDNTKELFEMDERHKLFKPAKEGNVYAFYALRNGGANDFWESGVAHPDIILKDIIWALHPTLLTNYTPTYIIKLE